MILFRCPACSKTLSRRMTCTSCGFKPRVFRGNIYSFLTETGLPDVKLSREKWDQIYEKKDRSELERSLEAYRIQYYQDTYDQVNREKKLKGAVYLEIGCGEFLFGNLVAPQCRQIVGVDFSLNALFSAKKLLEARGIKNAVLIHADINAMPIADGQVDLIYGGGVIEHFRSTETVVRELYRVLKKNGVSFNTVPFCNLGAVTYRQVWGNIPDVPVLKTIFSFIHMRLLRGKHMKFGYELSFTRGKLRRVHERAGFRVVRTERFHVKLLFSFLPRFLKRPAEFLAEKSPLFWPMIKAVARK